MLVNLGFLSKKINFIGANGDELAASLESPPYQPLSYALFAHCFTCSKDSIAAVRISRALTQFGIAVLRFDFTGLGSSQGDFANANFSSNVADLIKAADFLRKNYQAPQLLIGHSFGGAAVLAASAKLPEAEAIVTIGAPASTTAIEKTFAPQVVMIETEGEAEVTIAGRKFHIKKQLLDDVRQQQLLSIVHNLAKPLLLIHTIGDSIVDFNEAATLFAAAQQPKSLISLEGDDHLLVQKMDALYVANILAAWASRYVRTRFNEMEMSQQPDGTSQVIVQESKIGLYTQQITAGNHILIADEPSQVGGNDIGPSPYDFLLSALGACTSMTLRMYAERHLFPLDQVVVRLSHHKVYIEDCENCDEKNTMLDQIERLIELHGKLTEEQRAKLLEIANKCPVHRTLTSRIAINTKLI